MNEERDFFNSLVEAQFMLTSAMRSCPKEFIERVGSVLDSVSSLRREARIEAQRGMSGGELYDPFGERER